MKPSSEPTIAITAGLLAERRQANWLARSRDAMRDWVRRSASRRSLQQLDERMLKVEATIQALHTQIEALDKALALTAETLTLQQKLQAGMSAQEWQQFNQMDPASQQAFLAAVASGQINP